MQIVTRAEWGARPPTSVKDIATPTPELWLHHTASADGGASRIRAIQNFHMDSRGWSDIAYSYLINMSGTIYEGRGLGRAGAHTKNHNSISHGIAILGNYNNDEPTQASLDALVELIQWGHGIGAWPLTLTGGHRDTRGGFNNDCPGNKLYVQIPTINERMTGMTPEEVRQIIREELDAALGPKIAFTDLDNKLRETRRSMLDVMSAAHGGLTLKDAIAKGATADVDAGTVANKILSKINLRQA